MAMDARKRLRRKRYQKKQITCIEGGLRTYEDNNGLVEVTARTNAVDQNNFIAASDVESVLWVIMFGKFL